MEMSPKSPHYGCVQAASEGLNDLVGEVFGHLACVDLFAEEYPDDLLARLVVAHRSPSPLLLIW